MKYLGMPSILTKIRTKVISAMLPLLLRRDAYDDDLVRLGTEYGGWWIPRNLLNSTSICYCAGVGTDISFDLALIASYGCTVYGFDPTPKSIDWIAEQENLSEAFTLIPVGLGGEAGLEKFYAPTNPDHVSHSIKNIQGTSSFFEARVQTIAGLMHELGHDRVDLVKLDIEGAEHETISRLLEDNVRPSVICVEYDQPEPLSWAISTTAKLRKAGYKLVKVERFNFTFAR